MAAGGAGILSYFTRHRTAANLLLALMIVGGLAALPRLRAQYFPDVVIEEITVSVAWAGAGAEEIDRAVVEVLEPTLLVVEGVETAYSRASEGQAALTLEFEPGWDMARAQADVEDAVALAQSLPEDAELPEIRRRVWRDRVTDVVITGPVDAAQLGRFADEFVARLFAAGVTRTTISGVAAPEIVVRVPSLSLLRHDLSLAEIADAIGTEVAAQAAGDLGQGTARVLTGAEKRAPDALAGIVLRSAADGGALTLGAVAEIGHAGADRASAFYVGGNPAVSIRVDRSDQGDAIALADRVAEVAAEMLPTLPPGVSIDLIRARSEDIRARLALLLDNGAMGLGLVLALLFLFLNARTAFWVAAGIPVAMLAALAVMQAFGLTLNMISLFALILTLGIVVDDAIVVGEHADFRARRLGEAPFVAAENAARRMAAPVVASTLTTIAAFLGLLAISGRFGSLIADIPFTVAVVLAASLVECFLILPNHMAHALTHAAREHWYDWPSRQVNRGFRRVRDGAFRPLITWAIRLRYPALAGAVLLLASQVALVVSGTVQWRFFDAPEQASISGNFAMLPGATRADTLDYMRALQGATDTLGARYEAEHGTNPIAYVLAEIGGNSGHPLAGTENKDADLLGSISIELIDPDLRPYSSADLVSALQDAVPEHPMLEVASFRGHRAGPGGNALEVQFSGAATPVLKAAAEALKAAMLVYPEVAGLEDTLAYDKDEMILELTPQGLALGFTTGELGRVLRHRLNGIEAARFPDGTRSATVRVELPEAEQTADFLQRTLLRSPAGNYLPLADIVSVTTRSGFASIRRENGARLVTVSGDIAGDDADRAAEIATALRTVILSAIAEEHGVAWRLAGLAEQEDRFLSDALLGLYAALVAIFLILAWIFASWTRPLVVMSVIPFALVGAIWGHWFHAVPLSMFSVVGMIGMAGIIINDAIVLISTIDEYAARRGLVPAIIDASADRLRPVLLTTLTTVLGLAPLLSEDSSQAAFLKPTVITLVYGLGFGMVLVLVLVPALVAMQQDVGRFARALRRAFRVPATRGVFLLAGAGLGLALVLTLWSALWSEGGAARGLGLYLGAVLVVTGLAALGLRLTTGSR